MNKASDQIVTVLVAIVGVATLAVILSKKSNAAAVITASGKAFADALSVAVSPITKG